MAHQDSMLMIDDELSPRESLRGIFSLLYEVLTAQNREEALQVIRDKEIDPAWLHLKTPDLSEMDVLEEIKSMGADVDVIIISGHGTLKNSREAMNDGAVHFIAEPFNVSDIVAGVEKSVEIRKCNKQVGTLIQKGKDLGGMEGEETDKMMLH